MADEFNKKRKAGLVQGHGSGFGGSGFKFNDKEEEARKAQRKVFCSSVFCLFVCGLCLFV